MTATAVLIILAAIWMVLNMKSIAAIVTGQAKLVTGNTTTA